jgi:hypothetical protein
MSGQINRGSELGEIIYSYAKNVEYKSYLEIGTWNGQGSTKCFIDGLLTRDDNYSFLSLESSYVFYRQAIDYYGANQLPNNIQILHGKIIDNQDLINTEINDHRKKWLEEDLKNYSMCNNLWYLLNKMYDVVLLDGGEFSTFAEFIKLKDLTRILILDDTKEIKNSGVVKYLKNKDREWKTIIDSNCRNGYSVYERIFSDK